MGRIIYYSCLACGSADMEKKNQEGENDEAGRWYILKINFNTICIFKASFYSQMHAKMRKRKYF